MHDFKLDILIDEDEVYEEDTEQSNTFRSVDELVIIGVNKNTIYREESVRKRRNEYSYRRYLYIKGR